MSKSNKKERNIYLDYAASVLPNPSSIHKQGVSAGKKLQDARIKVATILNARPEEIIFTSGGTESNNLAIQGIIFGRPTSEFWTPRIQVSNTRQNRQKSLPHIITTNIEHPSVLETCKILEKRGLAEISIISVEKNGIVDPKKIKKEIKKNTVLVSVNYANNEIGTIQPIKEIAKEIRHYKKSRLAEFSQVLGSPSRVRLARPFENSLSGTFSSFPFFHTDAVQAVNYLDINVEKLGIDLLSFSGSKIVGSGKVGVLYKKKSVQLAPIFGGGDQEGGLRPGTENLEEIIKFANALEILQKIKNKENIRLIKLRNYFFEKLQKMSKVPFDTNEEGIIINGDLEKRLPNIINITISKIPSELLVIELSEKGIMTSSKSACKSSQKEGSYVIGAIRNAEALLPPAGGSKASADTSADTIGGIRFSFGEKTTKADIDYTISSLFKIINKLKKWY